MADSSVGPVLVVESDEAIIKDISCSLRLIDIPVASAVSVEEAMMLIRERNPVAVLSRLSLDGTAQAAENLLSQMQADDAVKDIPLFVLATSSEVGALGEGVERYKGVLSLPVEFPAFPEAVKQVLALSASDGPAPAGEVVLAKVARHDIPDVAPDSPVDIEVKDRNLSVAYQIQSRVLQELDVDGRIHHARIEQVPGIVNQITAKVCVRYTQDKYL